jgi:hypothetical protein
MSEPMFSGWGIRTMAQGEGAYNPIGYHVGTVWPHDNSLVAMGLYRYGYRREAAAITQAMIEASSYFDARLPEAFAGYPRNLTHYPAEYPTACSPQAWATGTPLLLLRAVLGLEPRGAQLSTNPALPNVIGQLEIDGIPGRWGRTDIGADAATSMVAALEAAARESPHAVRELFAAIDRSGGTAIGGSGGASIGFRLAGKVKVSGDFTLAQQLGRIASQASSNGESEGTRV